MAPALAMPHSVAAQDEPWVLEPSSDWVLDYAEDSCALRRSFGPEDRSVFLEMRQFEPGDGFQVTIASSAIDTRRGNATVRYDPDDGEHVLHRARFADYGDSLMGVVFNDSLRLASVKEAAAELDPRQADERRLLRDWAENERNSRERQVAGITLSDAFEEDINLRTGALHAPMEAQRDCMEELLTHWGIDAEAHRSLTREARPRDTGRLGRTVSEVYPRAMVRAGNSAWLRIRLSVSEAGEVTACHLQAPIVHDEFREAACRQLMTTEFEPALDVDAVPIASYWTTTISFWVE